MAMKYMIAYQTNPNELMRIHVWLDEPLRTSDDVVQIEEQLTKYHKELGTPMKTFGGCKIISFSPYYMDEDIDPSIDIDGALYFHNGADAVMDTTRSHLHLVKKQKESG